MADEITTVDINSFASKEEGVAEKAYTSIVPESYKDKPYLKDVKSVDGLFAKLEGAQTLVGKKQFSIPEESASKETWSEFYGKAGRPDKAEGYEFATSELPEGLKKDDKMERAVRGLFHEAGISGKQAKIIQTGYDKLLLASYGEKVKAGEQQDVNFDNLASETFGSDRDKILANSKKLLEAHAPEKFKSEIVKLSNENLILMAGVLNSISKKYIKEDDIDGTGSIGGTSLEELRDEQKKIMASPEYQSSFHPGNEKASARLKEIADLINKL